RTFLHPVLPPGDSMSRRCFVVLAAFIAAIPLQAQVRPTPFPTSSVRSAPMMTSLDTMLFKGLSYRMVGPTRGGRVTTVTGVPSQKNTFYMGVASGGVFRTTDAGA